MDIVSAKDLVAETPSDLDALLVSERAPLGPTRRLFAVGDVGFCGALAEPEADPWAEVGPLLRSGDATFANLETPLAAHLFDGTPPTPFVGPMSATESLTTSGISMVSLANNHVADAGPAGIRSTLDGLEEAGVRAAGAGRSPAEARRLVVTELGDLRVGWLAAARTLEPQETGASFWELDADELLAAVARRRDAVDVLVVSLHIGYMLVDHPHPEHRRLALDLAEAGADLVLCHHAHVVQGVEMVDAGGRMAAVCHNLGNFLLDWTVGEIPVEIQVEEQRRGVVVVADVDRRGVQRLAALPTRVDDEWVVRWATGETGGEILSRLERISRDLEGDYAALFRAQRAERNTVLALRTLARRLRRGDVLPLLRILPRLRLHHASMVLRWLGSRFFGKSEP